MSDFDEDLARLIKSEIREVKKITGSMGAAMEAWREHMPPGLDPEFVRITSRRRLIVRVTDSSKRYIAELHLRSGVEAKILAAGNGKFTRLFIEVGERKK